MSKPESWKHIWRWRLDGQRQLRPWPMFIPKAPRGFEWIIMGILWNFKPPNYLARTDSSWCQTVRSLGFVNVFGRMCVCDSLCCVIHVKSRSSWSYLLYIIHHRCYLIFFWGDKLLQCCYFTHGENLWNAAISGLSGLPSDRDSLDGFLWCKQLMAGWDAVDAFPESYECEEPKIGVVKHPPNHEFVHRVFRLFSPSILGVFPLFLVQHPYESP